MPQNMPGVRPAYGLRMAFQGQLVSFYGVTPQSLKSTREEMDLSLREFGRLLGYSGVYIWDLERGRRPITDEFSRVFTLVLWP